MSKPFNRARQHSASNFTWSGQTGYAEASSLSLKPGEVLHTQVYDDACDEGFTLINLKRHPITTMDFLFVQFKENVWHYRSLDNRLRVVIWND